MRRTTAGRVGTAGAEVRATRAVIHHQLRDVTDPLQARALAVGLAIGGPEFRRP